MVASRRPQANDYSLDLLLPGFLSLALVTAAPLSPTSVRDPPILAGRSNPASYEVTTFPLWVLVCT